MTMKTQQLKPLGSSKSSSKREIYSNTILPQETRKTSNRQPHFTPKTTGKRRTTTTKRHPKISIRKEIINIWAEINEKEMKGTIVKINKTKSWFFEKINKIDKSLARLIKERESRIKSTKLEMKRRDYNRQCRNTKDDKTLLWTTIWK